MSKNYIVINGKKAELTNEQMKLLGIKVRNNPFERFGNGGFYHYINDMNKASGVYFSSEEGTQRAIKEVVEPFMKEHPEFVW